MEQLLTPYLPTHRIDHSKRVADMARRLAHHVGEDPQAAYTAGLLHDIAKYLSPSKAREMRVPISDTTNAIWESFPLVWHQFAGAELAKSLSPSLSEVIIDSIRWHTTGKANMSRLAQIIFIADYIEPGRPFDTRANIESLAFSNLDQAMLGISYLAITELTTRWVAIFPETINCYNFYLSKITNEDAKLVARSLHPQIS
jgi:predicted HD superfamily hydrolase involved in NAD metabolism